MILVKRISYADYIAAYKQGGALFNHYKTTNRELPVPLTEQEWINQQGSIEGPILQYQQFSEEQTDDETVQVVEDLKAVEIPDGWVEMNRGQFEKQLAFQEELTSRLQS